MAHNLNVVNGKAAMAYTGATPWHGLGTSVKEAMTSAEAIELAGLNWSVKKQPVFFERDPGQFIRVVGKNAMVRSDTKESLGVVGDVYRPLQNKEAFSFFDAVVGEKLAMYHTAGALGHGERIWMLAKLPSDLWITKDDQVEKFLLLTNSHNGSSAVEIMATPIRVVCQNTLNMAIGAATEHRSFRHTVSMTRDIKALREDLKIVDRQFQMFAELGKHLVSKKATGAIVNQLLKDLGLGGDESGKVSARADNIRMDILKRFEKGMGNDMPSVKGSAWALLNGVVEYVDYARTTTGEDAADRAADRTKSLLFGSGANMKQKALDSLLALTK